MWVEGWFNVDNASGGYHKILMRYWETHRKGNSVLLVSEDSVAKCSFQRKYPHWKIDTVDFYLHQHCRGRKIDIIADICQPNSLKGKQYDIIICQATLEHLYNPFQALENMFQILSKKGIACIHAPNVRFRHHGHLKDYFRFFKDWFEDIISFSKYPVELIEYEENLHHIFMCYRKI